jgi:hypothetical protein
MRTCVYVAAVTLSDRLADELGDEPRAPLRVQD